jgi:very-long-chain ceramide synthase
VNLFWLFLILRIARDYIFTSGLQDERSDDEESADERVVDGKNRKDGNWRVVVGNGEVLVNGHKDITPPFEEKKNI